jgi:SAM-dependent methyltransferase
MARSFTKRVYWRTLRFFGLKRKTWDLQFQEGVWDRGPRSPHTIARVLELCRGGKLVEFGCGTGTLPHLLPRGTYSDYLGIDISQVAIRMATERCAQAGMLRCRFQAGDMAQWEGSNPPASLILFEECIYYLSPAEIEQLISRCCSSLTRNGSILVIAGSLKKNAKTLNACRRLCHVLDERIIESRVYITLAPQTRAPCATGQ